MRAYRSLLIVVALLLVVASMANAQSSEYEKILNRPCAYEEVLRNFDTTKDPGYVPISLLERYLPSASANQPPPDDQIPEWVVSELVERINTRRTTPTGRCTYLGHRSDECDAPSVSVADVVSYQPVVVLGSIEHLGPVWSTTHKTILTVAYIRVSEVLKDPTGELAPGALVTHVRPWGSVDVGGVTICTYPPEGTLTSQATTDQDVVLAGSLDLRNDNHFVTTANFVFRVQGDLVLPPSPESMACFYPTPLSLDAMRELLEKK